MNISSRPLSVGPSSRSPRHMHGHYTVFPGALHLLFSRRTKNWYKIKLWNFLNHWAFHSGEVWSVIKAEHTHSRSNRSVSMDVHTRVCTRIHRHGYGKVKPFKCVWADFKLYVSSVQFNLILSVWMSASEDLRLKRNPFSGMFAAISRKYGS